MSTIVTPAARVFTPSPYRVVVELDDPDVELVVAVVAAGVTVAAWYDDRGRRLRRVPVGSA